MVAQTPTQKENAGPHTLADASMQMHCIVAHQNFVLYGLSRSISIPLSSPTLLVALSLHSYHSNQNTHTRIWPYIARTYINVKKGGSFRSSSTNLLAIARAFAFLLASYRLRERSKNLSFWCVCLRASSCFRCLGERDRDGHEQWLAWLLLVFFLGEGLWRRLW